jgi:WD40 repeat protein
MSVAIAPDGKVLASTSMFDPNLRLWDTTSGRPLHTLPSHTKDAPASAFSVDGKFVVTGGGDGPLRLWETASGKEVRQFPVGTPKRGGVNVQLAALQFSPDGKRLIAVSMAGSSGTIPQEGQIDLWDAATGERVAHRQIAGDFFTPRLTLDGRGVTVRTARGLTIQDLVSGRELVTFPGNLDAPLVLSPDGKILAAASKKPLPGMSGGSEVEAICLEELATGKRLLRIETGPVGEGLLAFSPDGRVLATTDEAIHLWDTSTGKEVYRRPLHERLSRRYGYSFVSSLAFLPRGDTLATGLVDSTILIWDLEPRTWQMTGRVKNLSRKELERLWADLPSSRIVFAPR